MRRTGHSWNGSRWRAGGGLLVCGLALSAFGGEPILFSSPSKDFQLPSEKERPFKAPSSREWKPVEPEMPFYLVPPNQPRDSLTERRAKELKEEKKNWLNAEPRVFRDPFEEPLKAGSSRSGGSSLSAFDAWDKKAERVLGTSDSQGMDNSRGFESRSDRFGEQNPRQGGGRDGSKPEKSERAERASDSNRSPDRPREDESQKEEERNNGLWGNEREQAMKALFEPKSSDKSQKVPLVPGMSIYEMMEASSRAAQKERDDRGPGADRQKDSERLLTVMPGLAPEMFDLKRLDAGKTDPLKFMDDPTSKPMRPGSLGTASLPEPSRNQPFPLAVPTVAGRIPLPKAREVESLPGVQGSTPIAKPQTRESQLESIKLIHRPSVLPFPGRLY